MRAYIASAENMPSGTAIEPGDVLRACNGKTIEVLNTDAEGRLVLADALAYAARRQARLLLDFATLTAAVRTALGPRCAAVMGTDPRSCGSSSPPARRATKTCGSCRWSRSTGATSRAASPTSRTSAKAHAGTIVGGLFLREFVGGVPWAHIDFSSTVCHRNGFACHRRGERLRCAHRAALAEPLRRSTRERTGADGARRHDPQGGAPRLSPVGAARASRARPPSGRAENEHSPSRRAAALAYVASSTSVSPPRAAAHRRSARRSGSPIGVVARRRGR